MVADSNMKIHINKGSNVITSLECLTEYLKNVVTDYDTIGGKGLDLYVNLVSSDGSSSPLNDKFFIIKAMSQQTVDK